MSTASRCICRIYIPCWPGNRFFPCLSPLFLLSLMKLAIERQLFRMMLPVPGISFFWIFLVPFPCLTNGIQFLNLRAPELSPRRPTFRRWCPSLSARPTPRQSASTARSCWRRTWPTRRPFSSSAPTSATGARVSTTCTTFPTRPRRQPHPPRPPLPRHPRPHRLPQRPRHQYCPTSLRRPSAPPSAAATRSARARACPSTTAPPQQQSTTASRASTRWPCRPPRAAATTPF